MRAATGFEPSDKWFGQQAVYRISMGNFLFFGCMSLALLGVKYKGEKRGQLLQHGNWVVKLVVWIVFNALPFLFPNGLVQAYGGCRHARCLQWHSSSSSSSRGQLQPSILLAAAIPAATAAGRACRFSSAAKDCHSRGDR
jgi:hypothetical protein